MSLGHVDLDRTMKHQHNSKLIRGVVQYFGKYTFTILLRVRSIPLLCLNANYEATTGQVSLA